MNCEELDSHFTQTSFYNNFNLYSQFSPPKDENKINLIETNNSTPSWNNEKNLRYSVRSIHHQYDTANFHQIDLLKN